MSRFVDVNGAYINVNSIKSCHLEKEECLHVKYADDTADVVPPQQAKYTMADLLGGNYIVQVIPVTEPVYAVYRDEHPGSYFADMIYCLVLCADGKIRGIECSDGWFDFVEQDCPNNCMGLYCKNQLDEFPGAIDGLTKKNVFHETSNRLTSASLNGGECMRECCE